MTQQYPPQYAPQPEMPKKKSKKKWLLGGFLALVLIVIIAAASSSGSKTGDSPAATDTQASRPATSNKADDKPVSLVKQFKAYVAKNGTPQETAAVRHVTKVQGANGKNDILDSSDIFTDYKGDMMSGDAANGKLIASSFRDWQASRHMASKNGLVTVYNSAGSVLSNGNY